MHAKQVVYHGMVGLTLCLLNNSDVLKAQSPHPDPDQQPYNSLQLVNYNIWLT